MPKPTPIGVPSWAKVEGSPPCPNCGGEVVLVQLEVTLPDSVGGGVGSCTYLGCPACPWASPSMTSRREAEGEA